MRGVERAQVQEAEIKRGAYGIGGTSWRNGDNWLYHAGESGVYSEVKLRLIRSAGYITLFAVSNFDSGLCHMGTQRKRRRRHDIAPCPLA